MAKTKLTKVIGEYSRGVISEDGVNYRHERQNMGPIIEHVKYLSEKVNTAPKAGNKHGQHYIGSIPMTVLIDWCNKVGIGIDAFARNQFDEKAKFLAYMKAEFPVFFATQKKSSQIIMPGSQS
jgi:hypothetical protein